jgi:hypothetical protein
MPSSRPSSRGLGNSTFILPYKTNRDFNLPLKASQGGLYKKAVLERGV